jgi:hypothetical protein
MSNTIGLLRRLEQDFASGAIDAFELIDGDAFLGVAMVERDGEPELIRTLAPIAEQFTNCRRSRFI